MKPGCLITVTAVVFILLVSDRGAHGNFYGKRGDVSLRDFLRRMQIQEEGEEAAAGVSRGVPAVRSLLVPVDGDHDSWHAHRDSSDRVIDLIKRGV